MDTEIIYLVTRADDAGSTQGANLAIREACEWGIARNISLMAPCQHLEHAHQVLGRLKGVDFGLHITLNAEWDNPRWGPVLSVEEVPNLVETDGTFTRHPDLLQEKCPSTDQMLREIRAQLARVREVGFDPVYIDEHMGVGRVGELYDAIKDLARQEGLIYQPVLGRLPAVEVKETDPQRRYAAKLAQAVTFTKPGRYLVVGHPCYDYEDVRAISRAGTAPGEVAQDRCGQRRMFTETTIMALWQKGIFKPIRYSELT